MPIFEFICSGCGMAFEEIVSADSPAPPCPSCASHATQRVFSAPSPLKKGAFPFKPQPPRMVPRGISACGHCGNKSAGGND